MKERLIGMALSVLFQMLTPDVLREVVGAAIKTAKELAKRTDNTIDDKIVEGLCDVVEQVMGLDPTA